MQRPRNSQVPPWRGYLRWLYICGSFFLLLALALLADFSRDPSLVDDKSTLSASMSVRSSIGTSSFLANY